MGALSVVHEAIQKREAWEKTTDPSLTRTLRKIMMAWFIPLRATEYVLRSNIYYIMKQRAQEYGLSEPQAKSVGCEGHIDVRQV